MVENCRTFAEIRITTIENISPYGSRRNGSWMFRDLVVRIDHSTRMWEFVIRDSTRRGEIRIRLLHISKGAALCILSMK